MRKLINGIVEFRRTLLPQYAERFRELAEGQKPDAFFISCSDSRVVPELLASTDPGDLFVMRNVGNMVPPAPVDGSSTGDLSEASAIEYALFVLNVEHIVVCGHSECGAMRAALDGKAPAETPNLAKWLHHSNAAVFRLQQEGPLNGEWEPHNQLSQWNVLVQLEHLVSHPVVRERLAAGKLKLHGFWFEISSGEMFSYVRASRSFEPIDDVLAAELLTQVG
ncbi:MAG: carbonic anhydrase [Acidobacteriota bacterium]